MTQTDLSNCDREPIHILSKIQEHGFLIAINEQCNITYCSDNISTFVPASAKILLGTPVGQFETDILKKAEGFFRNLIYIAKNNNGFHPINPYLINLAGKDFNLIISATGNQYLLEFEPAGSDLELDVQHVVGKTLSEILADANLSRLLEKTAEQIRGVIQYDRVMVYKFHDDGHGEVVAEAKNDDLLTWKGLHYPASDIPKQARELYKLNLVRLIADVEAIPSEILTLEEFNQIPLDLTYSSLRAVSPIHIQYLKNMGVASSFSVSLIHQGELWGLVACHNYTPRYIQFKQRDAAKLLGQVLSSALSFRQLEEDQQKVNRLKDAVDDLTRHLLRYNNIEEALFNHNITMLDAVDAEGAVLGYEDKIFRTGKTPDDCFLTGLISWLRETMVENIYATDKLSEEYPAAVSYKDIASGLLVCRLSGDLKEYLIWFRPEVATTVKWAGNPDKPVEFTPAGMSNISPRKSFEIWTQDVQYTSVPWSNEDFRSALQLKDEVTFAISRKATEIRILNDKLKEAYDELDAFSYTISHDLKNPLTTIKSYSQLLSRSENLEPRQHRMLEGILTGANRMQGMIEEVLHYSKAGQQKTKPRHVNMKVLLADLKEQLMISYEHLPITINIGDTPNLYGDETMIQQVFANLLGNAVKYSGKRDKPLVKISGEKIGKQIRYKITDNGIGIKHTELDKIFDLFTRSDDVDDFEGSGVGLAIVKKIMQKHNGRIWVESEPGEGSTFHVAFKSA